MLKRFLLATAIIMVSAYARSEDAPNSSMPSYPITASASEAREFSPLAVDFGNLKLNGTALTVLPISTEVGITGAALIGDGTYSYEPEPGKSFSGRFHSGILRFNPKDADAIIKFDDGKKTTDKGANELAQLLIAAGFRYCYHRGKDALIPPEHAIAAQLFSQDIGNVLISADEKTIVVFSITNHAMLYEKK
jgi:hypothetical protein